MIVYFLDAAAFTARSGKPPQSISEPRKDGEKRGTGKSDVARAVKFNFARLAQCAQFVRLAKTAQLDQAGADKTAATQ